MIEFTVRSKETVYFIRI